MNVTKNKYNALISNTGQIIHHFTIILTKNKCQINLKYVPVRLTTIICRISIHIIKQKNENINK